MANHPESGDTARILARRCYALGRYRDAIPAFRRAVELDASDAGDWFMLGVALRLEREAAEAQRCLERSLTLGGERAETLYELGLALENQGEHAAARVALQRALAADPNHVPTRAAAASLAAAEDAERKPPTPAPGKVARIAFHMNKVFHYPMLNPLFEAFRATHRVLFTADAINLVDFDPDVVVVCDVQAKNLRPLVPRAQFVNVRHGAVPTKNFAERAAPYADYVCVGSAAMKAALAASSAVAPARIWITGFVPMDPLFQGRRLSTPATVAPGQKAVLFAPTYNPHLSAAPMLGPRAADLIRGDRDDVSVVIKPHPFTIERNSEWMAWWRKATADDRRVHLVDDLAADVTPYLQAADVLVSDVSTVAFAFLALDRPIVLLANPDRFKDREHFDPDGFEWRCRDMAEDLGDVNHLPAAIARALDTPDARAARRRRYRDLLFGDCQDGRAVERIHAHVSALTKT
jgi:CDP-glycerol glycerophosphotransferase (TagB/SpsB family)